MTFEFLFILAIFGLMVANVVFRLVKHGGMRGVLLGARLLRTVGEIDLGGRGVVRRRLKVHSLESSDPGSPSVAVEVLDTSVMSARISPITLTHDQARTLAALLTQAIGHGGIHTRAPTR
jgi:hypothetical protein